MKNFRTLGTALALAGFVATAMLGSSARLEAAGPGTGGGRSNTVICGGLQFLHDSVIGVDSDRAAQIKNYAASIPCAWATE